MKKAAALLTTVLILLSLTSCSIFRSDLDIMTPPALLKSQEQVKEALDKILPRGYTLVYSVRGQNTSAVRFVDIDGNGVDETVAFYRLAGEIDTLNIAVLKKTADSWEPLYGIPIDGSDFVVTDFYDLNGDGKLELIAGRKSNETLENIFTVFSFETGFHALVSGTYSQLIISDITNDGILDVFYISQDNVNIKSTGYLISKSAPDPVSLTATVVMDGNIVKYSDVKTGFCSEGVLAVFCNTLKGANGGATEMIIYKNGELLNPFYDIEKGYAALTYNLLNVIPVDFDGDGIIEIPVVKQYYPESSKETADMVWLVEWNNFNGEKGLLKKNTVMYNAVCGYILKYPLSEKLTEAEFFDLYDVISDKSGKIWRITPKSEPDIVLYELFYSVFGENLPDNVFYIDSIKSENESRLWIYANKSALAQYPNIDMTLDMLKQSVEFIYLR